MTSDSHTDNINIEATTDATDSVLDLMSSNETTDEALTCLSATGAIYENLAEVPSQNPCKLCQCTNGEIVCAVEECRLPDGLPPSSCTALPLEPGQCCPKYECSLPDSTEEALETTTLGEVQDGDSEDYYDITATGIITKEPGTEETTTDVAASDEIITNENDGNESVTEDTVTDETVSVTETTVTEMAVPQDDDIDEVQEEEEGTDGALLFLKESGFLVTEYSWKQLPMSSTQ